MPTEESEMASFVVKSRSISPVTEATVDADSREHAIQATVDAGAEGGAVEILNCDEVPVPPPAPEGTAPADQQALPPPA
jgi:hypothetical protein